VELYLCTTIRIHGKVFNYVRSQILPYTLDKQLLLSKRHHAQEHSTYIAVMMFMYESHVQKMPKNVLPRFFETSILGMFFRQYDLHMRPPPKKEAKIQ
jgi:hypothetical protein